MVSMMAALEGWRVGLWQWLIRNCGVRATELGGPGVGFRCGPAGVLALSIVGDAGEAEGVGCRVGIGGVGGYVVNIEGAGAAASGCIATVVAGVDVAGEPSGGEASVAII